MTQNELDYKMQKTGATLDEYKTFAGEQVLDFTDEQKAIQQRILTVRRYISTEIS